MPAFLNVIRENVTSNIIDSELCFCNEQNSSSGICLKIRFVPQKDLHILIIVAHPD